MKHALIITHFGSGGTLLCRILSTDIKVRCFGRTDIIYDHPSALQRSSIRIDKFLGMKNQDFSDWYVDKLMHNYQFSCRCLYSVCKFIYLIRTPLVPLSTLIKRGYTPVGAETYYLFRLRRMCEMAVKTGGALLTYEDLTNKRAFPLLQNTLNLKTSLSSSFTPLPMDDSNLQHGHIFSPVDDIVSIPDDVLKNCMNGYNRYLHFMETRTSLIRFAV